MEHAPEVRWGTQEGGICPGQHAEPPLSVKGVSSPQIGPRGAAAAPAAELAPSPPPGRVGVDGACPLCPRWAGNFGRKQQKAPWAWEAGQESSLRPSRLFPKLSLLKIFVTMVARIGHFLLLIEIYFQFLNQVPIWP